MKITRTLTADGNIEYFLQKSGIIHRTDGPAIIYSNGTIEYYFDGILHRTDGPAVIHKNGIEKYYLNGNKQP